VDSHHSGVGGAVGATVNLFPGLDAVANHLAAAVGALGRERMNGTLEAVIMMDVALHDDLDGLVVIVAAYFAFHIHITAGQPKLGAPAAPWVFPGESLTMRHWPANREAAIPLFAAVLGIEPEEDGQNSKQVQ